MSQAILTESTNQRINESTNQRINESTNQRINESTNQRRWDRREGERVSEKVKAIGKKQNPGTETGPGLGDSQNEN